MSYTQTTLMSLYKPNFDHPGWYTLLNSNMDAIDAALGPLAGASFTPNRIPIINASGVLANPATDMEWTASTKDLRLISHSNTPFFQFDYANRKLRTRSTIVYDLSNPSNLGLRRVEAADPDGSPNAVATGTTVGVIWAQPYGSNADYDGASGATGRIGTIAFTTAETPTGTARGGQIRILVTKLGQNEPTDLAAFGAFTISAVQKVGLLIAEGGGTPESLLHVKQSGSTPTYASQADTLLVLQRSSTSDNCRMSMISGTAGFAVLQMGDSADDSIGGVRYDNSTNRMFLRANGGDVVALGPGAVVGSPTGGDKGAGSINAVTVWKNGTALDMVFEPEYALFPLAQLRSFYEQEKTLPWIPHGLVENGSMNLDLVDRLWETVEVQARYIVELHERVSVLESR